MPSRPNINRILQYPCNKSTGRSGASMGRRDDKGDYEASPLYLQYVQFEDGCYDKGGAYWGGPADLWCAFNEETETRIFVRASSWSNAAAKLQEEYDGIRFYPEKVQPKLRGFVFNASKNDLEIKLTRECIEAFNHSGACDADAELWVRKLQGNLAHLDPVLVRQIAASYANFELSEEELADHTENLERIIFHAAINCIEEGSYWTYLCVH